MAKKLVQTEIQTEESNLTISESGNLTPAINTQPIVGSIIDEMNVLNSSSLVKNNTTYATPRQLIEPLIIHLNGAQEVRCSGSDELEIINNEISYKAFQRFNVIAKFPVDEEFFYEVGVLVALDLQVPKIKVYSGAKIAACLNLSLFGHDTCSKFDLNANSVNDTIIATIMNLGEKIAKTKETISRLKNVELSNSTVEQFVGAIALGNSSTKNNFGTNYLSQGIALISDPMNKYYYKQDNYSAWKFYNAFTENIKKANIFDMADKAKDFYSLVVNNTSLN